MSDVEEGIVRLAAALDKQDMIKFTRSFVQDIRVGRESVNRELLPWLDELDTGWTGVLCLGMGGSAAGGDFLSVLCDESGLFRLGVIADMICLIGGLRTG